MSTSPSASAPLALAKASTPSTAGKIRRKAVEAVLDTGFAHHAGVWVAGRAGAGKTTAAATYLAYRGRPALWYRLDAEDRDPGTFFHTLSAGLHQWTGDNRPARAYSGAGLADAARFAAVYFTELFHRLGRRSVLVLDDCHEVPDGAELFQVLASALVTIADEAHILFLSRRPPPPVMSRLLVNGHIGLVRERELRATPTDVMDLFHESHGRRFPVEDAERMVAKVDGWFAALPLLLDGARPDAIAEGLHDDVPAALFQDYFAAEVFTKASPTEQDLMLSTSVLERFTPDDAVALTGNAGAGDILRRLCQKHAFIDEYLEPVPAFRFHPLFRDFLQREAVKRLGPDTVARLRSAAAQRMERGSDPANAIPHYLACEDWTHAARLLHDQADALLRSGRHGALERWIGMLPEGEREASPWLGYWQAGARMPTRPSAARADYLRSLETFERLGDRKGMVLALAGATDAVFFAHKTADAFDPLIERLAELMETWSGFPADAEEERALGSFCHALLMRRPDHPLYKRLREQLRQCVDRTSDPVQLTLLGSHLGTCAFWDGDLSTMQLLADRLSPFTAEPWLPPLLGSLVRMMAAFSAWMHAEPERCYAVVDEYRRARDEDGVVLWDAHLIGAEVAAALTAGDLIRAERQLKALQASLRDDRLLDTGLYYMLLCWYDLLQGGFIDARRHAEQHQRVCERFGATLPLACAHLASSRVADHFNQSADRERHLRSALAIAEQMDSDLIRFMCLSVQACHALEDGNRAEAAETAEQAFALGRRRAYVNTPLFEFEVMGRLCALALEHGFETDYARHLVERRRLPAPASDIEGWPWPLEVRALGGFEIKLGGTPIAAGRKLPERPLAILKYLIAHGGEAGRDPMVDTLWPDSDGDAAGSAFSTNVSRLRRLLGVSEAVRISGKTIWLDTRYCRLDTAAFERLASENASTESLERAIALYRGTLFGAREDTRWSSAYGERLQSLFATAVVKLAAQKRENGDAAAADRVMEQALQAEPFAESLYYRLIRFHIAHREMEQALALCHRGCRLFEANDRHAAAKRLAAYYKELSKTPD